jgi:tRNA pseudouridine65 synthase
MCVAQWPSCRIEWIAIRRAAYALLELEPTTGRRHQLRPSPGPRLAPDHRRLDIRQGSHNRLFAELFGSRRLLLASVGLALSHPLTAAEVSITAPLAADFLDTLRQLGWSAPLPLTAAGAPSRLICDAVRTSRRIS